MNDNENRNEDESPVLTVAEAAARLHVTIPRLRRMLARADFAAHLQQVERQTRTGTRTSTVLPVSVLVSLQAAFESGEAFSPSPQPEREQEQNENENGNAALATHQAQEIAFLRGELTAQRLAQEQEREQERSRHAQEIARRDVAEGETRRLLGSAMQQAEERRQEIAQLRQQLALAAAPVAGETPAPLAVSVQEAPTHAAQAEAEQTLHAQQPAGETRARKWWKVWKGRE